MAVAVILGAPAPAATGLFTRGATPSRVIQGATPPPSELYQYRTSAGARASTTTPGAIPAGAVLERVS